MERSLSRVKRLSSASILHTTEQEHPDFIVRVLNWYLKGSIPATSPDVASCMLGHPLQSTMNACYTVHHGLPYCLAV
jgi:hypothetical protein